MSSNTSILEYPRPQHECGLDNKKDGLRVAILSDAIQERNGAGTYYHDLVDELRGHVACAELICPSGKTTASYEYFAVPMPGDPTQQLRLPKVRQVSQAVRKIDPHVIVSATPGPYGFLGYFLARRWKLPFCTGHHTRFDKLVELYWRGRLGRMVGSVLERINGLLFRRSAMVVATSDEMVEHAQRIGARNVCLMGTPIGKRFCATAPPAAPREVRNVLFAGRLASEKNLEAVLEAAEQHAQIRFVIAGDGPQRSLVEKKAELLPNLTCAGWVPREDLASWFDACDLLVLPSHVESFGTVAAEAMTRRRAAIVSPHCGILDWQHLRDAVIPMKADETLAQTIARVSAWRGDDLAALACRAYEAVQHLNRDTAESWIDLLHRLVCAAPAGGSAPAHGHAKLSA